MKRVLIVTLLLLASSAAVAFDNNHAAWNALLKQYVVVAPDGNASAVRYAAVAKDRANLRAYLDQLSSVTADEFAGWSKPQRLAFLINAYNAYTVELILTRYPKLDSIKDIGGWFGSPWKQRFFKLLGEERHLDEIEHGIIRAPGAYDEPRIHVAVVCASIGCPMLRNTAFTADTLDADLADAMRRFLADQSRNRYDARSNTLQVSKIFDWYGDDFARQGDRRKGLLQLFAAHAAELAPQAADRETLLAAITADTVTIRHLDYDWLLNDAR
ncbi:MAG TPA: DUF547 domain-containing protein [Rhodocyclaceae bacterium]